MTIKASTLNVIKTPDQDPGPADDDVVLGLL
jgi:hypothetical protein